MLFKGNKQSKRDLALGLDLGSGQIKAAVVEKRGGKFRLVEYAVRPLAPVAKADKDKQLVEELVQLASSLKMQDRRAYVTISCGSAMVCQVEFPRIPIAEIRSALKLNSARYLRRDCSGYCLDVAELEEPEANSKDPKARKMKVVVAGANRGEVQLYLDALLAAKFRPEAIELAALAVVNAFQLIHPQNSQEVVLLVDLGARHTTMNFVQNGRLLITRIMHFGGLQLSEYVGQILALDPRQAEEEKVKMNEPVQALVRTALSPLARELRSSIDFFERQHDCTIHRVLACGGSACSSKVLEFLAEAVGVRIECWNPAQGLDASELNGDGGRLRTCGPNLAAAVGAAIARL